MGKFIPVEPEKWAEMVKAMAENARLKAEVERLTEAGDEMAVCFNCPTCAKNWNDAKKGGQP